jgi:hypothetical protein
MKTMKAISNKFGCIYKLEDDILYQSPILENGTIEKDDWAEVSAMAFHEKEREEFDIYIQKLFGKKIELF